jgi:hypothetical protein
MQYELKCNAPRFDSLRKYPEGSDTIAKSDFFSLQSQFEARGYSVKTFFRNNPMRGQIQVEIDGFFYYVELFKCK